MCVVCRSHGAIWLTVVKFLNKNLHLATTRFGEPIINRMQKKKIVNILADPEPNVSTRLAYNVVMQPEPIVHDIPRHVTYDSSVIALVQTFCPVVYTGVGCPYQPEGCPVYPVDTMCFYRRLSQSDREVNSDG